MTQISPQTLNNVNIKKDIFSSGDCLRPPSTISVWCHGILFVLLATATQSHHQETWLGDCSGATSFVWSYYHFNANVLLTLFTTMFFMLTHTTSFLPITGHSSMKFASSSVFLAIFQFKKYLFLAGIVLSELPMASSSWLNNFVFSLHGPFKYRKMCPAKASAQFLK